MALEGTVKTPFGPVNKKTAVIGGGIVAVLLVVAYARHKSAAAAAAAAAPAGSASSPSPGTGDMYPPDGTTGNPSDPYSTDPATGLTYGDEATLGGGFTGTGGFTGSGPTSTGGTVGPGSFANNAEWGQYCESALGSTGSDATGAALGRYLAGLSVTPDQQTIILQAIAIGGNPPVGGSDGYPPNIRLQSGPGPGGGATNPVTGLHLTNEGSTGSDIAWNASSGATGYQVTTDKGSATMTGATSARIHDIGPSHSQATVRVLATPAAANAVPAKIVVKVK